MFQTQLLQQIHQLLPDKTSLIEVIAETLDISYDAAHRRTSLKSKLSLDEGIRLGQRFGLSLDSMFTTTDRHFLAVERTNSIDSVKSLEQYFLNSYQSLSAFITSGTSSSVMYSAKDIPLFYTLKDNTLSRFKMYAWLKFLDQSFHSKDFEDFTPSPSLKKAAAQLSSIYQPIKATEIWGYYNH